MGATIQRGTRHHFTGAPVTQRKAIKRRADGLLRMIEREERERKAASK